MSRTCLILTAAFLAAPPARAQDTARLAAAAQAALTKSCARCHAGGQAEGGFGFVLDARQLVARKKVVAGDAARSRLFKRVQAGEMPPEDEKPRPTPEEVAVIKAWIDAGAPAFSEAAPAARPFLPDKAVLAAVRDHLRGLPPEDQPFQRYFTPPTCTTTPPSATTTCAGSGRPWPRRSTA
jgi:mono/diheme cytochrome c family protein